jgi:hypothetical protein
LVGIAKFSHTAFEDGNKERRSFTLRALRAQKAQRKLETLKVEE